MSSRKVCFALCLACVLGAPLRGAEARQDADKQEDSPEFSATAKELLTLHNAERAKEDRHALRLNAKLCAAAQDYAEFLAKHHEFGHDEDGSPGKRVKAAGYKWHVVGENIAEGQHSPEAVVKAWMHSPGHRANILGAHYKDVGFGMAKGKNGQLYWVTDFAAPF